MIYTIFSGLDGSQKKPPSPKENINDLFHAKSGCINLKLKQKIGRVQIGEISLRVFLKI
jgi:hypothetical protein